MARSAPGTCPGPLRRVFCSHQRATRWDDLPAHVDAFVADWVDGSLGTRMGVENSLDLEPRFDFNLIP